MTRFDSEGETDLNSLRSEQPYSVDYVPNEGTLSVTFHSLLEGDHILRCNDWLWLNPEFAVAFAHAYATGNLPNAPVTRSANRQNLSDGFIYWVAQNFEKHVVNFPDFTVDLFDKFDKWLEEKDEIGSYYLNTSTALHYRSALRGVVSGLKKGEWHERLPDQCRLRKALFANKKNQNASVEPYDLPTFCSILGAIKVEAKASLRHLATRTRLLGYGRAFLDKQKGSASGRHSTIGEGVSKGLLMARLQKEFGPVMPPLETIRLQHLELYEELQDWGAGSIYAALHPSQGDLLPFAYQLCVLTAFNPTPLLSLQLDGGVKIVRVLRSDRVVLTAYKGRSQKFVTASFLDTDRELSAPFIVNAVRTWTEDIRAVAPVSIRNDFWLFVPRYNSRDRSVRTMRLDTKSGVNYDVNNAVTAFHKLHGLPRVSFVRIRATVAALAHDLFGGDLRAMMDFLQHSNPEVTLRNYTSGVGKARHREIISTVQQLRERWVLTDGKLDPRILAQTGDPSATTPGWQCADAYNSPIPGQKPGRLCDAYGSCAACPLARVDHKSAVSFARIDQVCRALENAKHRVLPERWAEGLAPLHQAITEFWLPAFSEDIALEAQQIHLTPIVPFD